MNDDTQQPNPKQLDPDYPQRLQEAVEKHFADKGLPPERLLQLVEFGCRLAEASQEINLTRILEPEDMAVRHFLDTFQLIQLLHKTRGPVLDIGTGGGVPGFPLAIMRRDLHIVMIDGTAKKIHCLRDWIKAMGLRNAEARHARAEIHLKAYHYPVAITRAAVKPAAMLELLQTTGPSVEQLIFMEGAAGKGRAKQVLPAARRAGYKLDMALPYRLPGLDRERFLIVFKKQLKAGFRLKKR